MAGSDSQNSASMLNLTLATPAHTFVPIESLSNSPTSSAGSASVLEWNSNSDSELFQFSPPASAPTLTAPLSPQVSPVRAHSPPILSSHSDEPFAIDWGSLSLEGDLERPAPTPADNSVTTTAVDDIPALNQHPGELDALIERMCLHDTVNKWQAETHSASAAEDSKQEQSPSPKSPSPTATQDTSTASTILAYRYTEVESSTSTMAATPPPGQSSPARISLFRSPSSSVLGSTEDAGAGISIAEYFQRKASEEAAASNDNSLIATAAVTERPPSANSALSYFSQLASPAQHHTASMSHDDETEHDEHSEAGDDDVQFSCAPSSPRSVISDDRCRRPRSPCRVSGGPSFPMGDMLHSFLRTDSATSNGTSSPIITILPRQESPGLFGPRTPSVASPPWSLDMEFAAPSSPRPRPARLPEPFATPFPWPGSRPPTLNPIPVNNPFNNTVNGVASQTTTYPAHRSENLPSIPSWLSPPNYSLPSRLDPEPPSGRLNADLPNVYTWMNKNKPSKPSPLTTGSGPSAQKQKQRPPLPPLPNLKTEATPTPQFALRADLPKPGEGVGTSFAQAFPSGWSCKSPPPSLPPSPPATAAQYTHYFPRPLEHKYNNSSNGWSVPPVSTNYAQDDWPQSVPPVANSFHGSWNEHVPIPPPSVFDSYGPRVSYRYPLSTDTNNAHTFSGRANNNGYTIPSSGLAQPPAGWATPQRRLRFALTPSPPPPVNYINIPNAPPLPTYQPLPPFTQPFLPPRDMSYQNYTYSSPAAVIPPPSLPISSNTAGWYTTSRKYCFADATVIFRASPSLCVC
ncbi:hypothetical protein BDZ97DRAFT_112010 [Flammula alnicola]|nr:hypothetical protein BDZ97DRAFT_112010 [Flammula alnicola]